MANQFIVNLSTDDGLPIEEALLAGWDDSAVTWVADGTSLIDITTVTGSGAGGESFNSRFRWTWNTSICSYYHRRRRWL